MEARAPEDQVVLWAGTPLEAEAPLSQHGVEAVAGLHVAGCRLGGKARGSLARAGTVVRG